MTPIGLSAEGGDLREVPEWVKTGLGGKEGGREAKLQLGG